MATGKKKRQARTEGFGGLVLPLLSAAASVALFFLPMADLIHARDPEASVRFWTVDYITFLAFLIGLPLLLVRARPLVLRLVVGAITLVYLGHSQLDAWHMPGVGELALLGLGAAVVALAGRTQIIRALVALYALAYFGFLQAACPRVPGALELILLHLTDEHQIIMHVLKVGLFLAAGLLFGRVYCGWVCPKGTIQEYLIRKQLKIKVPERVDRVLKSGKYVMLAVLVLSPILFEVPVFRSIGPFKVLFNLDGELLVVIFLAVVLVSSLFIERAYCRYFCPEGALLALAQLISPYRLRYSEDACVACGRCLKVCPVDALRPLAEVKSKPRGVSRTECIACLECRDVCRDDALYYGLPRREEKKRS